MANKPVGVDVDVNLGSMRAKLREATADLHAMREAFGDTSEEAIRAARAVAELRDEIGDARAMADAFNPDAKFTAFAGALQGVVGGFEAVQGAMALFGVESEEVQKTLLKVQSAMALSQGLNSVLEAKDAFKNLGAVIAQTAVFQRLYAASTVALSAVMRALGVSVDTTSAAFKGLASAMVFTGIGAVILAIGIIVSQLNSIADAAQKAEENVRSLQASIAEGAQAEIDARLAAFDRNAVLAKKRYEAETGNEAAISSFTMELYRKRLAEIERLRTVDGANQLNLDAQAVATRRAMELQEIADRKRNREAAEAAAKQAQARADAAEKKRSAEIMAQRKLDQEQFKNLNEPLSLSITDSMALVRDSLNETNKAMKGTVDEYLAGQEKINVTAQANALIRKKEQEAFIGGLQVSAAALDGFAELAGKNTAAGKALSIASTIISTIEGAQSAYANALKVPYIGTFLAPVAAAGAIAAGLARVKAIAAVQIPGQGGGSGAGSIGSVGGGAPITPNPTTQVTTLNQSSLNALNQNQQLPPQRVYVLERDVTEVQQRAKRIEVAATV